MELILKELTAADPNQKILALEKYQALWRFRYQVGITIGEEIESSFTYCSWRGSATSCAHLGMISFDILFGIVQKITSVYFVYEERWIPS